MIDLCMTCVETINNHAIPTKIVGTSDRSGMTINHLSTYDAKAIMSEHMQIEAIDDGVLPMVAVTTVHGTRLCGQHTGDGR